MILEEFPPMGVYETLFKFAAATDKYMGEPGTHPWAQGFPLTTQLPGGPPLPNTIKLTPSDLKYPTATGNIELRRALASYFNEFYDAGIDEDHVAVFAGGRPAILATLAFLQQDTTVAVEETEYTPYYDLLERFGRKYKIIPSNEQNRFSPGLDDYDVAALEGTSRVLLLKSNPCNPTGVVTQGETLRDLVAMSSRPGRGALVELGLELYTGDGGFYYWGRLPGGLSADEFNERLFTHDAGILPGPLCDMQRRKGAAGPLHEFVRFSFGPLSADSFDENVAILKACL